MPRPTAVHASKLATLPDRAITGKGSTHLKALRREALATLTNVDWPNIDAATSRDHAEQIAGRVVTQTWLLAHTLRLQGLIPTTTDRLTAIPRTDSPSPSHSYPNLRPVCPNCGQWQHRRTPGGHFVGPDWQRYTTRDCFNECATRGLHGLPLQADAHILEYHRSNLESVEAHEPSGLLTGSTPTARVQQAQALDRIAESHPPILAGDLADWTSVRAGRLKVRVLSGWSRDTTPCAYGRSTDAGTSVLVRITTRGNPYYREGERVSVSPTWLSLRTRHQDLLWAEVQTGPEVCIGCGSTYPDSHTPTCQRVTRTGPR